jgi:hypothetical protein
MGNGLSSYSYQDYGNYNYGDYGGYGNSSYGNDDYSVNSLSQSFGNLGVQSHGNYSSSSEPSSSGLRIVKKDPGDGKASSVCAIACVAGISYAKAWNTALKHGFTSSSGMIKTEVKATLDELGVRSTHHRSTPNFSRLPDLAIIPVVDDDDDRVTVVFARRSNGREYIYDSYKDEPVGTQGYQVKHSIGYIEVGSRTTGSSSYTSTGYYNDSPPSYFPPSYYNYGSSFSSSYPSSSSSSNLRIVRGDPEDTNNCAVCAMASATGIRYSKVWNVAVDKGFDSKTGGMLKEEQKATLDALGVSSTMYDKTPDWDDLPDLAIVSVKEDDDRHAVTFERRADGSQWIYDMNHDYPTKPYEYDLIRPAKYIKIHKTRGNYA